ncbi:hypothetical protein [Altererythrobacter aquiaggeris]|uniref:hypothetical protein n=1 Tax=Aestuarierythrobacter aquiaggeris TaxID=1898396 RepID=UPI003017F462
MDSNLMLIFAFVLVIVTLVFAIGSGMHKRQLAYRERKEAFERQTGLADPAATSIKVEQLEQRVRVLERLATDRGQDLALQIEELRESSGIELEIAGKELAR